MSNKKEIVEKINATFMEGSTDGFLDYCAEDVEWTMIGGGKTNKGKAEIREWMSHCEGMEPPKFTVDEMIAEGDSVACYGSMTMKDENGEEGKYSYVDVYRFRGDEVARLQSFIVKHKTEGERKETAAA